MDIETRVNQVETLFNQVMDDLGHTGWKLNWVDHDSYCWRTKKQIDICPMRTTGECQQMLLHEIAHIEIIEPEGTQHTKRFWAYLEYLIRAYLYQDLDDVQLALQSYSII